jgi:hypothetical protein
MYKALQSLYVAHLVRDLDSQYVVISNAVIANKQTTHAERDQFRLQCMKCQVSNHEPVDGAGEING